MKKFIQLIFALSPFICQAQFGNVWCFGNHYKLDFNYNPPIFSDSATSINVVKGSSSVCDSSGQLLFYTDGTNVWNKLHQQMPNGDSMAYSVFVPQYTYPYLANGFNQVSYQPAIIIPKQNSDKYYIFTTDYFGGSSKKLCYNIIDLSLNNGLGDVILKNQILDYPVGEKMAVTRHCNGVDWWVVVHKIGTDEYHSFLATPNSVSTVPIISHTGGFAAPNLGEQDVAYSKISPNGKFIASNYEIWGGMELGSFNNQTGQVQIIYSTIPSDTASYGCAFSADSKYLYRNVNVPDQNTFDSTGFYPIHIFRYTLTNPDSASIAQSKIQLIEPQLLISDMAALQLAPDGNIYVNTIIVDSMDTVSTHVHSELWKIKPNVDTLFTTGIILNIDSIEPNYGLPSFPDAIFTNHHKASLRIPTCITGVFDSIPFYDSLLTTTRDYIWDFGDPSSGINNTFNGQFPIHTFSSAGTYTVTLTLPSDCNPISISQQVTAYPLTANIPTINLNSNFLECTPASTYQWYLNNNIIVGATNQTYTPLINGDYTVTITDSNNCSQTSSIYNFAIMGLSTNNFNNYGIYPNPASNLIQVNNPNQKQSILTISDLLGNIVVQSYITKQSESINTNQLSNGIYIVNIENNFNQKLVINR